VSWIYEQKPYLELSKAGIRPRLMHLYTNENSLRDIKEVSRLFYIDHDTNRGFIDADKSVLYFEFDQWDSRYNNISAMLYYFINTIMWHFWDYFSQEHMLQELNFLNDTRAWSLEDLYHVYSTLRFRTSHDITFFLSGFDQCSEEQRRWFLGRVLEEQSYSEAEYRLILSTSTRDGLALENIPDAVRINVDDCPTFVNLGETFAKELETGLVRLLKKRLIYEESRQQLEMLLSKCEDTPYLGHVILTWLENYPRGRPKSEIAVRIDELWPPTAENIVNVIVSSLSPELRERAENVFNWVKYALEPWSAESLAEALAVFYSLDQEACFIDLQTEDSIQEISAALCGIIIVKGTDVKFSHPSFYSVPAFGVHANDEERAAKINGTIAEVCLRYLQLEVVQDAIIESCSETLEGSGWETPVDAVIISPSRANMAGYAVRFWPLHYEASGNFRPRQLVYDLFASHKSRGCWETYLWLLSNPLTRPQRGYISTLPMFARLGLEDLIDESIKLETGQSTFNKDCWFAITEAARIGRNDFVRKLLQHVSVDEEELQTALLAGSGHGDADTMSILMEMIPKLGTFQWPKHLFHRASAIGLGSLLTLMLQSGYNINEPGNFYKSSPATMAAWRGCVSSLDILLDAKFKADLSIKGTSDDTIFTLAVYKGDPRIVEMVLKAGGNLADTNGEDDSGQTLAQIAVYNFRHKAADILVRAGADFNSGQKEDVRKTSLQPPLIIAARIGALECTRILLTHGADPLVSCAGETTLYAAVVDDHIEIARLLLEQEQKPDINAHPAKEEMLLMRAVNSENADLVSMLIENGVEVDFVDPNGGDFATPLSRACGEGYFDIVKLLLEKNADINYTGGTSDSPLFAAIYLRHDEIVKHLLQDERVDIHWAARNGVNALLAAYRDPETVRELLKRGLSVNHYSSWGTVLHLAAARWPKTIKVLLEHDPKPDLERVCGEDVVITAYVGCTPLQIACQNQASECVELLLNAGANAKFRNNKDADAVDILLQSDHDLEGKEQCLRLILSEAGQFDPEYVDTKGQTRLHMIKKTTSVAIVQLLVKAKVPLNRPDNDGYTPLAISIREGNSNVAKYLVDQGASVNVFSPSFGSILHLAVAKGDIGLVKLLIDAGADREAVDPKYSASLLYTALGIRFNSKLRKMVKYLVDEAKVPINKLGGELGYPIIRAADMTRSGYTYSTGVKMLRFLIRRKAQLNVTDRQGRSAMHLACTSEYASGIIYLAEAGAEVDMIDKFGRMPIHFAASSLSNSCIKYLLDTYKHMNINAADHDGWTPLLWAARSGDADTVTRLIAENADVSVRGRAYGAGGEWSALKLMNFADRAAYVKEELKPKQPTATNDEEKKEEWSEYLHQCRKGDKKNVNCKSCLVVSESLDRRRIEFSQIF
jgi:ankyrin repeat protein